MHTTDILIIGAGPVGLFTVFEAGLLKLRCHLVDYLPQPGGQCSEIYPKKPIYDIPGYPSVLAGELVDNLMKQAEPFKPQFTLGERAESIEKNEDGHFVLTTHRGTQISAPVIAIAGGLGCFEPRKPALENLELFEDNGVDYIIRNPEDFKGKDIVVAGGGDSALDWTIVLAELANSLTLVHRRKQFRGAPDSVQKVEDLAAAGNITLLTDSEISQLHGNGRLESVTIKNKAGEEQNITATNFIPLFGLSPKLGPIGDWGLNITRNAIEVDPRDYSTNMEGIYAIGDICEYPGKLKLILCGFHEAAMMCHSAFEIINPGKKHNVKYTTVTGIKPLEEAK